MSAAQTSDGPALLIAEQKRFATAQALAALRGMTLRRIDGDFGRPQFIATFHALTRPFADLAEVEGWLEWVDGRRVGAAQ